MTEFQKRLLALAEKSLPGVHLRIRIKFDSGQWRRFEARVAPGDTWTLWDDTGSRPDPHEPGKEKVEITVMPP
jgi:hypothetical protein